MPCFDELQHLPVAGSTARVPRRSPGANPTASDHDSAAWPGTDKRHEQGKPLSVRYDERDGQQTPGSIFRRDKILVARMLDDLGIDYVEGGYPGANPTDTAFFADKRTRRAAFTAFGMVKRAGRSVDNDPGLQDLLRAKADAICFVGKTWDFHVRLALGCSNEENLESIGGSIAAAVAAGREAMLDCEHFFDGYKANRDYALSCVEAAWTPWRAGGACDTNGGTQPDEVRRSSPTPQPAAGRAARIHATTQPARRGEFARRRAGGARQIQAAERHRRALRQRRSGDDHSDAHAEAGVRGAF